MEEADSQPGHDPGGQGGREDRLHRVEAEEPLGEGEVSGW